MENFSVDNPWAFLAVLATASIPVLGGIFTMIVTRKQTKADEELRPELVKAAGLQPVVDGLLKQVTDLASRVETMEPIVFIKWPLLKSHVETVHRAFPNVRESVPIPEGVVADIDLGDKPNG